MSADSSHCPKCGGPLCMLNLFDTFPLCSECSELHDPFTAYIGRIARSAHQLYRASIQLTGMSTLPQSHESDTQCVLCGHDGAESQHVSFGTAQMCQACGDITWDSPVARRMADLFGYLLGVHNYMTVCALQADRELMDLTDMPDWCEAFEKGLCNPVEYGSG